MRVLVTGGAGFIGSHIVDGALHAGHEVAVLDNLSTGKRENVAKNAHLYHVDLRDRSAVFKVLAEFRPTVINHQAAQASVSASVRDPHSDADVNIMGGLNLLDAATQPGLQVQNLVIASTGGAIYGEVPENHRADEGTIPNPQSPYAISKLALEQFAKVYQLHRQLPVIILRYANVYGPRQDPHGEAGVVAIFCTLALAEQPLRVNARRKPGDLGCVRDYVYVGDVAKANLIALEGKLLHSLLNIGTGTETTTQALAETIRHTARSNISIEHGANRPGDLERSVLEPSRCTQALGQLCELGQGLEQTFRWYRSLR